MRSPQAEADALSRPKTFSAVSISIIETHTAEFSFNRSERPFRRLGTRRVGPRRLGPHRVGTRRLGTRRVGPRRVGPRRLGTRRLGTRRLGPRRLGTRRVGTRRPAQCLVGTCPSRWDYFGGRRAPPSTRITSAFMYGLVINSTTIDANSSPCPSRLGNSTDSPNLALNASDASPVP